MAKIVRHRTVTVQNEEGEQVVRLKKWSAAKLFFLVREFWSLIEEGLEQVEEFDKLTEVQIIRMIIERLLSSEEKAAKLIEASVDDPADLSTAAILDWDAADFVNVLTEVIEMNWNEELSKNFQRLLGKFLQTKEQATKPRGGKTTRTKDPEPEPAVASTA
jgi:hypothetical protein